MHHFTFLPCHSSRKPYVTNTLKFVWVALILSLVATITGVLVSLSIDDERYSYPFSIDKPTPTKTKEQIYVSLPQSRPLTVYLDLGRHGSSSNTLKKITFDHYTCQTPFPVNDFPLDDPFLPWIHDYFVRDNEVVFVAQNRRRCHTGEGMEEIMRHMEPQISLFQPVMVTKENDGRIRLAKTWEEATHNETRFMCHFHNESHADMTFSTYPFNYEYVFYRKHRNAPGMVSPAGSKDAAYFDLSTLLFRCPLPSAFKRDYTTLRLNIIPIRTATRNGHYLFSDRHVGQHNLNKIKIFNASTEQAHSLYLPSLDKSGRIANIPLCRQEKGNKINSFVICSWQAASYHRRGDTTMVNDTPDRLREWIIFHQMVGIDHIYLYDNTQNMTTSPLAVIAAQFPDFVTYHAWPARVCNNNRPQHANPGERSSQYAAEASCRERYGQSTQWMAFVDVDEYLVPLKNTTWKPILDQKHEEGFKVLKMRSSRGRPRYELLRADASAYCNQPEYLKENTDSCLVAHHNESFLRTYNCDYIKPPRPERFQRAMKQIYQPSFVLNHFVHYAAVTKSIAQYFADLSVLDQYKTKIRSLDFADTFLDEIEEGILMHAKSVMPYETSNRNQTCRNGSRQPCLVGYPCSDSIPFDDKSHNENPFRDLDGKYCNCWIQRFLEDTLIPSLHEKLHYN